MLLVKGLCIFTDCLNPKWACFPLCSEMWSYFRLDIYLFFYFIIAHHLVLQCIFHLGLGKNTRIFLFFSTAVNSAWRLDRSLMRLRPNDWTVLLEISPQTLNTSSVKFCSHGSRVGEKGLAQSWLEMPCITRMQMSYEAIHLLEMPPWFQFESCLQSHCVSPLLHVKEVSFMWEIRGG